MKSIANILADATAMWILAGINAAMFITAMCGADLSLLTLGAGIDTVLLRPWSPFSYMFVQILPGHFAINIIGLVIICTWFEHRLGPVRLIATYLAGGLAGAAAFTAVTSLAGTGEATLAGSSAAVLAVYAAIAIAYRRRIRNVSLGFLGEWSPALPLMLALVSSVSGLSGDNPAGNLAHLAGITVGFIIGHFMARPRQPRVTDRDIIDKFERSGYSGLTTDERRQLFFHNSRFHGKEKYKSSTG